MKPQEKRPGSNLAHTGVGGIAEWSLERAVCWKGAGQEGRRGGGEREILKKRMRLRAGWGRRKAERGSGQRRPLWLSR